MPFLRSQTSASSTSPLELVRAFLQSIMGAPLRSRNSFTCAAEMVVVVSVLIMLFPSINASIYNILTRVALRLTRAIFSEVPSVERDHDHCDALRPPGIYLCKLQK